MAKASKKKVVAPDDPLAIPDVLKRDKETNVSPAMEMGPPRVSAKAAETTRTRFDKPRGMTDAEYDAALLKFAPREAKKKDDAPKAEKKVRVPRAEAPAGTFKLSTWATSVKLDPRHVRRVARTIKGELSKLYVNGMKYVFADASKDAVAKMINDGLAAETKKTVRMPRKAKTPAVKIPPPSETVWSGKAKKAKPGPAPKTISPKDELRRVAKKAVREHGKRNIVKVATRAKKARKS